MLVGRPNPHTYPFESISMSVKSPYGADSQSTKIELAGDDLFEALQYNQSWGLPSLVQWLTKLAQRLHAMAPNDGSRVSVGAGSQDLIYKAFTALINPGDTIFVEAPTYP